MIHRHVSASWLILLLLLSTTAVAQQQLRFSVVEFGLAPLDLTAQTEPYKKIDGSGSPYAIIKVTADSPDDDLRAYQFNFGNMNHLVEDQGDQLWLYVQKNAKQVTITRQGYAPVRNYDLRTTIEAGRTYTMHLSAQGPVIYTQMVMFSVQPADSRAVVMITREGNGQGREMLGMTDETGGIAKNLELGTYIYEVAAENYHSSEGRFTLQTPGETHLENIVLRSNGAKVTLSAAPETEIFVNGTKRGTGSWTGVLKAGNHTVECRMSNHRPSQQGITIEEGKDQIIQLIPPTPIIGTLSVNSRPLGAKITIDGKDYGTTPRNITDLLIGHHRVVLSKDGYTPKTEECEIREAETYAIETTLEKSLSDGNANVSIADGGDKTFTVGGVLFTMKAVSGGTFTMGATAEDAESYEKPAHQVTLSGYLIGETEVTQALWQAVMGSNPSYFKGENLPVEDVRWEDCQTFLSKLNQLTGQRFRLPTEAEWEYAARGGNKSRGYKYSGSNNIGDVAWYTDNSSRKTHDVKTKSPNELGLYDMSGNVWEWCQDWYGRYSSSAQSNPTGASSGSDRVNRGGGWFFNARYCRVSHRDKDAPAACHDFSLGLRLAL